MKPLIIHAIDKINGEWRYLCNQAVKITDSKSTLNPKKATCKNCINKIT